MRMQEFVRLMAVGFAKEFRIELFNIRILMGLADCLGFVFGVEALSASDTRIDVH